MNTSIDLSGKLDGSTKTLFRIVDESVKEIGAKYLLVGATARDLLYHHAFGVEAQRATKDTDFAIYLSTWKEFDTLIETLVAKGFRRSNTAHRLIALNDTPIDLVPFGELESPDYSIEWPSNNENKMNVLGFQDALKSATHFCVDDEPRLEIPVVTAEGIAVLKTISWTDRAPDLRGKDAEDLLFIAEYFERVLGEEVFQDAVMELYEYDITLVGAYLLGQRASSICSEVTSAYIRGFLRGERDLRFDDLKFEALENGIKNSRADSVLQAFADGYLQPVGSDQRRMLC